MQSIINAIDDFVYLIYSPVRWFEEYIDNIIAADAKTWIASGVVIFLIFMLYEPALLMFRKAERRTEEARGTHGTARFAETDEIEEAGMYHDGSQKMILGEHGGKFIGPDVHGLILAPNGTGKGVGTVIPTLLTYRGSVVVNDPKGENFMITSRYRGDTLGQQIVHLDPFSAYGDEGQRINPLDYIASDGPGAVSDSQALAVAIFGEAPEWDNKFFYQAAQRY